MLADHLRDHAAHQLLNQIVEHRVFILCALQIFIAIRCQPPCLHRSCQNCLELVREQHMDHLHRLDMLELIERVEVDCRDKSDVFLHYNYLRYWSVCRTNSVRIDDTERHEHLCDNYLLNLTVAFKKGQWMVFTYLFWWLDPQF